MITDDEFEIRRTLRAMRDRQHELEQGMQQLTRDLDRMTFRIEHRRTPPEGGWSWRRP